MSSSRSAWSSSSSSGGGGGGAGGENGELGVRLVHVKVRCELCNQAASVYCAADAAQLCKDCDARIHSANFLVARHSRTFLCAGCGALISSSPASGFHVCQACAEAAASVADELLHCDEESKIECNSDDEEEEQPSCLVGGTIGPLLESRKRPPENKCWMEEVGDSEEEDYLYLASATFKRRNIALI